LSSLPNPQTARLAEHQIDFLSLIPRRQAPMP
jgi:hypothetical protein